MSAVLEAIHVSREYRRGAETVHALRDVTVRVEAGELVGIVGQSGSGKSTLMNVLGCLDRPTGGSFRIAGNEVASLREPQIAKIRNLHIGFVFQAFHLLPRATAVENVALPLTYRGLSRARRTSVATAALRAVGLGDRLGHLPGELSGGQRQRVAIARAIAGKPSLILADEPTGNLDSVTGHEILSLFSDLHARGHTLVVVTHDEKVARRCSRILRLVDGRIYEQGSAGRLHELA
jgi:putative ABC transport system ATP-binding protein